MGSRSHPISYIISQIYGFTVFIWVVGAIPYHTLLFIFLHLLFVNTIGSEPLFSQVLIQVTTSELYSECAVRSP